MLAVLAALPQQAPKVKACHTDVQLARACKHVDAELPSHGVAHKVEVALLDQLLRVHVAQGGVGVEVLECARELGAVHSELERPCLTRRLQAV